MSNIDLEEISSIYDEEGREIFISIYLNMQNFDEHFIENRIKECMAVVKGVVKENFKKTMDWIHDYIKEGVDGNGLIIFSSYIKNFFSDYVVDDDLKNLLVVDSSPYLKPIADKKEDYEEYALVIIGDEMAQIFSVSAGRMAYDAGYILKRHLRYGWSEEIARIWRKDDEIFMDRIASILNRRNFRHVFVAVPYGEEIGERLSSVTKIDGITHYKEGTIERNVKKSILRNSPILHKFDEIRKAIKDGEIELIAVKNGMKVEGWRCDECNISGTGNLEVCPVCGKNVKSIDVISDIVEMADENDIFVKFSDDDTIQNLGGVIAFLRESKRH